MPDAAKPELSQQAPVRQQMTFEVMKKQYYPEWGFRPGTVCYPMRMSFVLMNGGMGDYITWMRPIQWLAEEATWIDGEVIVPVYLQELATYWLRGKPWRIKTYRDIQEARQSDEVPYRGPVILQQESLNATGAHLSTCGWVYFTNKERAPEHADLSGVPWDSYPRLLQEDLDRVVFPEELRGSLPKRYAVITTGITTESRKVPGAYWNPIIEHVIARDLTPVFLGKSVVETGNPKNIHTQWGADVRYDLGIDLRDKTTLMQAAALMSHAAVVIGHDNGLLHLAGCTDVPIVYGYNMASPDHREPKRPSGNVFNVTLTREELVCNFCQSKINFVVGFDFKKCFYGDLACIKMLFANGAKRWLTQIDRALEACEGEE